MIRFERVTKRYADGTEALSDLSFEFPEGELTVVIGPSGCGKTTLMKMVNKLVTPTEGRVSISGKNVSSMDEVALRRSIGYVIQRIGLFPHMTVERNASLVPDLLRWPKEKTAERISTLLEMTGLDPSIYLHRYPLELSGGQQQRIGVVRALAGDPEILLMDEPFSALDPISREQLQEELRSLQSKIRKTIIFVTHDMDEALKIADRIVIMRAGVIEQTGTPEEVMKRPASVFVKEFIGAERISRLTSPGDRKLRDCPLLAEADASGGELTIPADVAVREAAIRLRQSGRKRIAVLDGNLVLGYMDERTLLHALLGEEGESA